MLAKACRGWTPHELGEMLESNTCGSPVRQQSRNPEAHTSTSDAYSPEAMNEAPCCVLVVSSMHGGAYKVQSWHVC